MSDKVDSAFVSYILGIVSIVLGFIQPVAGLIFGIIGVVQSKRDSGAVAKKGKKLSIIGIVISVIVLILVIVISMYAQVKFSGLQGSFPGK
jgi:hypothetical protein